MKRLIIFAFIAVVAGGTLAKDPDYENIWVNEYSTLKNCLAGMEYLVRKYTGKDVSIQKARISTDKPDKVNGWFDFPKNRFECRLKQTGTKGTYWEGLTWIAEKHKPS